MRGILAVAIVGAALVSGPAADAAGTGFDPRPIVVGPARQQIKSLPIENRPNRPLHVYGNSVRRRHDRGAATARPRLPR
jgi:hypothetical protein